MNIQAGSTGEVRAIVGAEQTALAIGSGEVEVLATPILIALMEKALEGLQALSPGRFIVQYLPFLQYAPKWFPVIGTQLTELADYRMAAHTVRQGTFLQTKQAMVRRYMLRTLSCSHGYGEGPGRRPWIGAGKSA